MMNDRQRINQDLHEIDDWFLACSDQLTQDAAIDFTSLMQNLSIHIADALDQPTPGDGRDDWQPLKPRWSGANILVAVTATVAIAMLLFSVFA